MLKRRWRICTRWRFASTFVCKNPKPERRIRFSLSVLLLADSHSSIIHVCMTFMRCAYSWSTNYTHLSSCMRSAYSSSMHRSQLFFIHCTQLWYAVLIHCPCIALVYLSEADSFFFCYSKHMWLEDNHFDLFWASVASLTCKILKYNPRHKFVLCQWRRRSLVPK